MTSHDLEREFANPAPAFRAKPFWAWNDKLNEHELRRQIRIFKTMGLGGFFMHSRIGLNTPYLSHEWFDLVAACIDEAQKTGTEAWLYDEDRWPSGAAGGLVTRHEHYRMRSLVLTRHEAETFDWPDRDQITYIFGATFDDEHITWYKQLDQKEDINILPQAAEILAFQVRLRPPTPWYNHTAYLDTLNPQAVAEFIQVTHEAYRQRLGEHFGRRIPGIFTDEPNCLNTLSLTEGLAWTDTLPRRFADMFDYDLIPRLPEVTFDHIGTPISQVRYHYHVCKTRMFVEAFSKQIGQWCERNNLHHTGHVLCEQPISSQVTVGGSAMQFYPYMQAPGVDILTAHNLEYITVKQCASVARQTGRKWVLSELYGCTGWDTTFETYKHSGDWQAALGITLRCPHLSWYSMAGQAKRDYPPSIHFQSPWWQRFRSVEDYFSRLNVVLTAGRPVCDLAVIHPVESYYLPRRDADHVDPRLHQMDRDYDQLVCRLLGAHLDFDFIDEHLLVELDGHVAADGNAPALTVGQMTYRAVLVPPVLTLRQSTLDRLTEFAQAGGTVVFVADVPPCVDAKPDDRAKIFAADKTVPCQADAVINALEKTARRVSIRDRQNRQASDVFYQFRHIGDDWAIFLANTHRERAQEQLTVRLQLDLPRGGQIQLWDPATGQKHKLAGELTYKTAQFNIDIPPSGSRLIVISSQPQNLPAHAMDRPAKNVVTLDPTAWSILLDDHNVLVLDRPDAKAKPAGHKPFSRTRIEILRLDRELRNLLDLPPRGGQMAQPWVTANDPLGPTLPITLTYTFNVKAIPTTPVLLALEQPQRWTIALNGKPIDSNMITGWWVDPAIKTIPLDAIAFKRGKNTLTLQGQFDRLTDLEIIYLLGQFGAEVKHTNVAVTKPPAKLKLGPWRDQGLPFYSGNVTYRTQFDCQPHPDRRYTLAVPNFHATALEITLNHAQPALLAWPDYHADITDVLKTGRNTIDITLLGSRRNAFGPLHLADDNPTWIGPHEFIHDPDTWQDDYKLVDYGLYEPPIILEH